MGNALKRADRLAGERLKHETIGGETFVDADEPDGNRAEPAPAVEHVPTTFSVDPRTDKVEKFKALDAQAAAFLALFRDLSTEITPNGYGGGREFSKAREKVEEAVMWAQKAIIKQKERAPTEAVDGVINERAEKSPT